MAGSGVRQVVEKTCTKCARVLPLSEFFKKLDGITSQCKTCIKENNLTRYRNVYALKPEFMERMRAQGKKWHSENKDRAHLRTNANHRALRQRCLSHYGGECGGGGELRYEFLSLDHVGGGGNSHRIKTGAKKMAAWCVRNKFPPGFRVLCHNCNMAIGFYGYCPHQSSAIKKSA